VLALELAHAALARGERVVYLTAERAEALLQQARFLGIELAPAVREGRLVLLQLEATAAASARQHGAAPLMQAVAEEAADAALVLVESLATLTREILDSAPLRAAVEALLGGTQRPGQCVVATVDSELASRQPELGEALADLCGVLVDLGCEPDGARSAAVRKSRIPAASQEPLRFAIGPRGTLCAQAPAPAGERPAAARAPATSPAAAARPRVLVIDEDDGARAQVVEWLARAYEVATASNGVEAFSAVLSARPDAIVLELVLPRVSGYEVLAAFQRGGVRIPVLVLSGRVHRAADRIRPFVLGAGDIMTKPPTRVELLHRVESLLRSPRPQAEPPQELAPELLFETGPTRVADARSFRERAERCWRFGERFEVVSSLAGLEVEGEEEMERLLLAAESSLRAEDAVLPLDETRALLLLVASAPESVPQVVARLVARSGSAGARPLALRARAGELRGTQGLADLEKCFSELAPLAPGGGPR
jgi:CheY-like chemotaxis protein/KaiC/GvpD/RAD55 family RecA-like ATPase